MKKWLIIFITAITFAALVVETYKSFFAVETETELTENTTNKEKDCDVKKDFDDRDKLFNQDFFLSYNITTRSNFFITHSFLLPHPYTAMLEMPPELL